MVPIRLVYSIYDSTEVAIQKMIIEVSQRMINEQLNSPPINEHFKLQFAIPRKLFILFVIFDQSSFKK